MRSVLEKKKQTLKISADINKCNYRVSPCCKNNIYLQSRGSGSWSISVSLVVFNSLWCARPFGDGWQWKVKPPREHDYMIHVRVGNSSRKVNLQKHEIFQKSSSQNWPVQSQDNLGCGLVGAGWLGNGQSWVKLSFFWDSLTHWGAGKRGWDIAWEEHIYGRSPLDSRHNLSALWNNLCSQDENWRVCRVFKVLLLGGSAQRSSRWIRNVPYGLCLGSVNLFPAQILDSASTPGQQNTPGQGTWN